MKDLTTEDTENTESDTPETDKAFKYWPSENAELVDANFARKLERERDEAREQVKNLEDQRDLCMKTICRLEKELDAIRAVFGHGANDADWKPGTTLAEAVEKVMRERDEEKKESKKWEKLYDDVYDALCSQQDRDSYGELETLSECAERIIRERNEARKLACLYKDQFYAVSMPTVKPPKFSWEEGYIK